MTEIIKEHSQESIQKAASVLRGSGIIIYPTETLYGIGALAQDETAVEKIFNIKGRPEGKPIPILVKDKAMMSEFAEVTDEGSILIERFLPGPLTLVFSEKKPLPSPISTGTGKIAVRISGHPFVKSLFDLIDKPLTSTSANISGKENIFDFREIYETFKSKVELIVDSGTLPPSKGSTIVDLTVNPPLLIREGDISKKDLGDLVKW